MWMPVSHEISRFNRCVFGLSTVPDWTQGLRRSQCSRWCTQNAVSGLPLPGCRSTVPALLIMFECRSILPHFEHLLWACLRDTWTERTYVQIKYSLTLFIYKTICCLRWNWSFLCFVISQRKVVALDRWGGKWNHLSMRHRLTTNYAKNIVIGHLLLKLLQKM